MKFEAHEEKAFWMRVYAFAIRGGSSVNSAIFAADNAILELRARYE